MGQFYAGAPASFIDDKMFKLPYELIGSVIEKKDREVDESQTKLADLSTSMLEAQGLKPDQTKLEQIKGGYETQINDLTKIILDDPTNAATYMSKIEALKKKVNQDWKMGEVAAIQSNRTSYLDDLKSWKELQKKDPNVYTEDYISQLSAQSLAKFKGTNYKGPGEYSSYTGESAYGMPDMNKWVDERLKEAMPDVTGIEKEKDSGNWLVKTKNSSKIMSEQALNEILQRSFQADTNLQQAIKQRSNFGMQDFQNLLDEKGEFLPTIGFNEKGKAMRANNLVGNAFKAGLEKFGFRDVDSSKTISEDPFAAREDAARIAKRTKDEDTEFVNMTSTNTVTTYNGNTSADWNNNYKAANAELQKKQEQANTVAMQHFGVNSMQDLQKVAPTVYASILKGNYSVIDTPIMRGLQSERKKLKFEQSVRANTLASFQAQKGGKPINWKDPKVVQEWGAYVKNHSTGIPDARIGWGYLTKKDGTPLFTGAQVNSLTNQASELLGDATISLPKGTMVKVGGKSVDLSRFSSVNEMINAGIATIVQEKAGEASIPMTTPTGVQIGTTTKVIFKDGKTTMNFAFNPKSLQPVIGASESGKVDFQVNFNLNGKTHTARIKDMSSEGIDTWNRDNAVIQAGRRMLAKVGKGSAEIPDSGGIIYHGSEEKNSLRKAVNYNPSKTYSGGWLQVPNGRGGYEIIDLNSPGVEQEIYSHLID